MSVGASTGINLNNGFGIAVDNYNNLFINGYDSTSYTRVMKLNLNNTAATWSPTW